MCIRDWLSNLIFNLIFWVCAGTARRTLWSTLGSSERWRSPDSDFYLLRIDDTKALHSNTHTRSLQEIGTLHSLRKTGNIQQNFDAVGFFSHFKKTKNFLYLFQVSLVNIFFFFSVNKSSSAVEAGVSASADTDRLLNEESNPWLWASGTKNPPPAALAHPTWVSLLSRCANWTSRTSVKQEAAHEAASHTFYNVLVTAKNITFGVKTPKTSCILS